MYNAFLAEFSHTNDMSRQNIIYLLNLGNFHLYLSILYKKLKYEIVILNCYITTILMFQDMNDKGKLFLNLLPVD